MAIYQIRHEETSVGYFDIEADDINDAIEKFQKKYQDERIDLSRMGVIRESDSASDSPYSYAADIYGESTFLARSLLAYANRYPSSRYGNYTFATEICSDDKTLQQSIMKLFVAAIREMAEVTPDIRNEQTVELAKKIVEIADGYYFFR